MYFHASSACLLVAVMPRPIEPLTAEASVLPATPGAGTTPTLPAILDSLGRWRGCTCRSSSARRPPGRWRIPGGRPLPDIRANSGWSARRPGLHHVVERLDGRHCLESRLAVGRRTALIGGDQRRVVADQRLGLGPAPDDREFDDALVLDGLGLRGSSSQVLGGAAMPACFSMSLL